MTTAPEPAPSAWAPLHSPLFRGLWLASFASSVGTLMQSVGVSWMMTTLSASPLMVALVQTATNLPTFLLALPAGALADVVDRRRLLLVTQTWMLVAAALLAGLSFAGWVSPWMLLGLTFALGLGAALNAPAWQAIVPELVPREQLASAVAVNSAGFNLARAVGPAIGGLIVARLGAPVTFALNAASFVAVLVVLYRWKRETPDEVLPGERVLGAMQAGIRYVRHAPGLRRVLVRAAGFMVFGSALWALLPLIARQELGMGAEGYGLLLASLGLGAVAGALVLPRLRNVSTIDQRVGLGTLTYALGAGVPAAVPQVVPVCVGLFAAGMAWLVLMAGFNTAVQSIVPGWVRGRALAVYLLIVFGGLAGGSALWGAVAGAWSLSGAILASSAGMLLALAALGGVRLAPGESINLSPVNAWPEPHVALEPEPDHGPVFVFVEYWIDLADEQAFLMAMREVRRTRLRDGAMRWTVLHDLARPGRYVESFMVDSWLEHKRQHGRVTAHDAAIQAAAAAFHRGEGPPRVSHMLASRLPRPQP